MSEAIPPITAEQQALQAQAETLTRAVQGLTLALEHSQIVKAVGYLHLARGTAEELDAALRRYATELRL